MNCWHRDLQTFIKFLTTYLRSRVVLFAFYFEKFKNFLVDLLMFKRGAFQKKAWHTSMIGLSAVGIITSGVFGTQTILSSSYPGVGGQDPRFANSYVSEGSTDDPVLNSLYDTHTNVSNIRSETTDYEVKSGDTLSSIAKQFDISIDTIKWANNMDNIHSIKPGDKLKILPVTGVAHAVKSGDTLESVAKKYSASAQAVLDYPFNDVPDDMSLKVGQLIIIPDGTPPEKPVAPKSKPLPQYLAQGPGSPTFNAPGGGNFIWPTRGVLTQYFSWYHPGLDVANPGGPAVAAGDGGRVAVSGWPDNWGFGNRVVLDHGNGYTTTYAHLSNIYVTVGQTVSRGQVIGQMGSTGRSTGTHLHLEIRYKGIAVNPLAILK